MITLILQTPRAGLMGYKFLVPPSCPYSEKEINQIFLELDTCPFTVRSLAVSKPVIQKTTDQSADRVGMEKLVLTGLDVKALPPEILQQGLAQIQSFLDSFQDHYEKGKWRFETSSGIVRLQEMEIWLKALKPLNLPPYRKEKIIMNYRILNFVILGIFLCSLSECLGYLLSQIPKRNNQDPGRNISSHVKENSIHEAGENQPVNALDSFKPEIRNLFFPSETVITEDQLKYYTSEASKACQAILKFASASHELYEIRKQSKITYDTTILHAGKILYDNTKLKDLTFNDLKSIKSFFDIVRSLCDKIDRDLCGKINFSGQDFDTFCNYFLLLENTLEDLNQDLIQNAKSQLKLLREAVTEMEKIRKSAIHTDN